MSILTRPHRRRRSHRRTLALALSAVTAATSLGLAAPAGAGQARLDVAAAAPGTPVPPLAQVNQSANGGDNTSLGLVPATAALGRPDAGVVPIVGNAAARADDGAYVAYESRVNARVLDLMVSSPALAGAAPVRVFLPSTYTSSPRRTYPVLLLLPGASEKADYQAWSLYSRAVRLTASTQALVVMPSVGSTGFGSNWTGAGRGYQYDTFLATELPQLLARGYRASGRTVAAGVSTGGYTAFALAALHPGRYAAAASYSGLLNPSAPGVAQVIQSLLVREGLSPWALWGDPFLGILTWLSRDPTVKATGLRGTRLFVSSGNGSAGPLDDAAGGLGSALEVTTLANSQAMVAVARTLGLDLTSDFYGNGTHGWRYWDREFKRSWPMLSAALRG